MWDTLGIWCWWETGVGVVDGRILDYEAVVAADNFELASAVVL